MIQEVVRNEEGVVGKYEGLQARIRGRMGGRFPPLRESLGEKTVASTPVLIVTDGLEACSLGYVSNT